MAIYTFETFWPLTAGKTMDEQFYFLKTFKESLRGMLIFGVSQKADYAVLLGTKRVLEADKLIKAGKKDLASQTLKRASEQFRIALENVEKALREKNLGKNNIDTMKPRLNNLTDFLPTLNSDEANGVLQKVRDLNGKI